MSNEMKETTKTKNLKGKTFTFNGGSSKDGVIYVTDQKNGKVYFRLLYIKKNNKDSYFIHPVILDTEDFQTFLKEAKRKPLVDYHRSKSNRQPYTLSFIHHSGDKKPDGSLIENEFYPYMLSNYILGIKNGHWQKKTEFADGNGYSYSKDNILIKVNGEKITGRDYLKRYGKNNKSRSSPQKATLIKKNK